MINRDQFLSFHRVVSHVKFRYNIGKSTRHYADKNAGKNNRGHICNNFQQMITRKLSQNLDVQIVGLQPVLMLLF